MLSNGPCHPVRRAYIVPDTGGFPPPVRSAPYSVPSGAPPLRTQLAAQIRTCSGMHHAAASRHGPTLLMLPPTAPATPAAPPAASPIVTIATEKFAAALTRDTAPRDAASVAPADHRPHRRSRARRPIA